MKSNKYYNFPFWVLCCALVLGVFLFSKIQLPLYWTCFLVVAFIIPLFFFKRINNLVFIGLSSILFVGIGGLRYQLVLPVNNPNHLVHLEDVQQPKEVVFIIKEVFKDSKKWKNLKVSVSWVEKQKISGELLLKVKKENKTKFKKGESFIGILQMQKLVEDNFSYGFSYTNYLKSKGITHQSFLQKNTLIRVPEYDNEILKFTAKLQLYLNESLKNQQLNSEVIQLTQALVLGNKKELDKELSNDFAKAGVIHILAISGLHIGIIYMVFVWLFKLVLYRYEYRVVRSILVLVLLWLFAWFSGASPSALRATTMFSCFEISRLLLRRQHPLNSLFLSIFILFLIDPKIIFSVGFQLSVTAVASIIIGMPKLNALWFPKTVFGKYVWGIICVSLCAQIGLLPISVYYFHQIPTLFLVANIPVMICIPFIMGFAIFIVLGGYFEILPEFVINTYNYLIMQLIGFVNWVASFEAFVLKDLYISTVTVFGCYVFFVYLRWWYNDFKKGLKYVSLPLACILTLGFVEVNKKAFKKEIWLLNDYKNTLVVEVSSDDVNVFSEQELAETDKFYKIKPLLEELHFEKANYHQLQQAYTINNKSILVINQNFIPKIELKVEVIILSNSPKINLERLIETLQPKKIIVTSKNKAYLIEKWKATCEKFKIPFYNVEKEGSLELRNFFMYIRY